MNYKLVGGGVKTRGFCIGCNYMHKDITIMYIRIDEKLPKIGGIRPLNLYCEPCKVENLAV